MALGVLSLWGEGYFCWAVVLTPLRTPRAAFVDGCCRFLAAALASLAAFSGLRTTGSTCIGNEHRSWMLTQDNMSRPALHRLAIQTGKESIQSMGVFARFGHHDFIASQEIAIRCARQVMTKEHPKQRGPRDHRGEKRCTGR